MDRSEQSALVQVEEGHNLAHIFGLLTGFHKQLTVMECKANDLLYMWNDIHVAQPARSPSKL